MHLVIRKIDFRGEKDWNMGCAFLGKEEQKHLNTEA